METRRAGWRPPHCPNPNCHYHTGFSVHWPFKRKGYFTRACTPHRIQRFTCLACGRHFSSQTFSVTYWQKRPGLIVPIASSVVGCMANRQMARALGCAHSTVTHQVARLGRHCLLWQARELRRLTIEGDVVVDGFEGFEWSQYHPFHHNMAVDVNSGYFLFHTDSPLRRKGRMTETQKRRRCEIEAQLGRPDPQAVRHGMRHLLETVTKNVDTLTVRSDDHKAYPPAIRSLRCKVHHLVTSSKAHRDRRNPLWEINLLDLMTRHSLAIHKRETIAWAKRRQAAIEKVAILQAWRNYCKRRWENGPAESSAMIKGLADRILTVKELLARRLFRSHIHLPAPWDDYYDRLVETPALGVNRMHTLTYAY